MFRWWVCTKSAPFELHLIASLTPCPPSRATTCVSVAQTLPFEFYLIASLTPCTPSRATTCVSVVVQTCALSTAQTRGLYFSLHYFSVRTYSIMTIVQKAQFDKHKNANTEKIHGVLWSIPTKCESSFTILPIALLATSGNLCPV